MVTSLLRAVFGFAVALALGIPLGVALAKARLVKETLGPVVLGLGAVPSVCWLPLAILWFGLSEAAIQTVVILGALLPVAVATEGSVRHVAPVLEKAGLTLGATGWRLLVGVTLPAAFPGILSGVKLGWSLAIRSLMAGELLFVSGGLGQMLETGRDIGDTALVVAVVLMVVLLGRSSEWVLFRPLDREVQRRWGFAAT
jgi:NitT/TauT family transport system permease protein